MASITNTADASVAPRVDTEVQSETTSVGSLSMLRNMKLGLFHIGSSMADILTTGVWNRIVINELGLAATPVALLVSLKYFVTPLSVWAGQRSDISDWRGYRRLPFIWGGRLLMMLSFFLLGLSTVLLADNISRGHLLSYLGLPALEVFPQPAGDSVFAWIGFIIAFLLFSVGSALSGTTFLSLVYDITPRKQQTRAISVIWFFLILGFAGSGIFFGILLKEYTRSAFISLFIIAPLVMGAIWLFSVLGEEKPHARTAEAQATPREKRAFWSDLRTAWNNQQTRLFFAYLGLSTLFFYTQDVILEPFGGKVFGMSVSTTSRFNAYWGSMALIGIIVCLLLARRYPQMITNMSLSKWSLYVLVVAFGMFLASAVFLVRPLVTIALIVMGIGLGMWTVGGLGLMMDMTRAFGAGLYLSLWTVSETLARGLGTILGGVVKDTGYALIGQYNLAYGAVFAVQVIGFIISIIVLSRVDVDLFHHQQAPDAEMVMSSRMD
ncbi:MAG: BCD family MFS transporter [Anaerolineae bacterium]|nr:BCD family MFS transporter [Anaerolineae bacterium]